MMGSSPSRSNEVACSALMMLAGMRSGLDRFPQINSSDFLIQRHSFLEEEQADLLDGVRLELARTVDGLETGVSRAVCLELLEHLSLGFGREPGSVQ